MSRVEIFKIWYRSLQADGAVWCESSNAREVAEMSEGIAAKFERLVITQVTGDWEPWTPAALDGGQPDTPAPTLEPATDIYGRPCTIYMAPEGCTDPYRCRVHRGAYPPPAPTEETRHDPALRRSM